MGVGIADGVLGFATSFMDNMWNSYNVEQTNAANRDIAYQTNQYNAQIARDNREYDRLVRAQDWQHYLETDQEAYRRFLENREYESLGAQMQRMRENGVNPYLAMYGGSGHLGSSGGSVPSPGSPPSGHNGNNQPFATTGAPMQAYQGGLGLTQGLANLLAISNSEREDYRLASDITFRDYEARQKHLEYLLHKSKNESEAEFMKAQIQDMDRRWKLDKDKLQHIMDVDNLNAEFERYRLGQKDAEIEIQALAVESGIQVNMAQCSTLYAQRTMFMEEAHQMKLNGASQRLLNNALENKENEIVRQLMRESGEDEEQLSFEKRNSLITKYKRVANAFLAPVRGFISAGANISSKVK